MGRSSVFANSIPVSRGQIEVTAYEDVWGALKLSNRVADLMECLAKLIASRLVVVDGIIRLSI
jgi:hypothetical protein